MSRQKLEALWEAANNHALLVCGEFVVEGYKGEENPPPPSDDEIVELVTEYLKSTI